MEFRHGSYLWVFWWELVRGVQIITISLRCVGGVPPRLLSLGVLMGAGARRADHQRQPEMRRWSFAMALISWCFDGSGLRGVQIINISLRWVSPRSSYYA